MADYATTGRLKGDLIVAEVCMLFGWDWETYHEQPQPFLDLIIEKLMIDKKREEHEMRKAEQQKVKK